MFTIRGYKRPMDNANTVEPTGDDFTARVRSAVIWRSGSQVLAQIITWTTTILVVRLLNPSDYGLFAMTQAVLAGFAFLNGYGFASSLIQARELEPYRVRQVFGLLLVVNLALAGLLAALAPLAAAYYSQPEITQILRVQALIFLTTPLIALPSALLARKLDFRRQAVINLATALAGAGTSVGLALAGYGVWALVWAPIVMFTTRGIGLTIAAGGLVRPAFDFRGAGDIVGFGTAMTLVQLGWIIQSQSDIVIAGRAFDPHSLGLYSEALFLVLIFTGRFIPPLNEVAFPAYVELHKAGRPIGPAWIASARLIMLIATPFYVGLALVADPLVRTFFGPKWTEMIPVVSGLAIVMPAMVLQILCAPSTNALGRPRLNFYSGMAGAIIMPVCFWVGVRYGPDGLVQAWHVAAPLLLAVTLALTLPAIGARLRDLAVALWPVAVASAAMAAGVMLVDRMIARLPPLPHLLLIAAVGAGFYMLTLWAMWPHLIRDGWSLLRGKRMPLTASTPDASGPAPDDRTTTTAGVDAA